MCVIRAESMKMEHARHRYHHAVNAETKYLPRYLDKVDNAYCPLRQSHPSPTSHDLLPFPTAEALKLFQSEGWSGNDNTI